jgi:RimJ/RimL family protein N-acetyltransferase
MEKLEIRYSQLEDYKYLLKWLKNYENNQFFIFSKEDEIEISCKNWIGFSRYRASLTGIMDNEVVAIGTLFLMPYRKLAHEAMIYLIVDDKHRNKGIGSDMLKNLIHLAKNYFNLESVFAEVIEGSKIESLFRKKDFEKFAYQNDYVKDENGYRARILYGLWF